MNRLATFLLSLLLTAASWAQTFVNTVGSDDATAISGYDPVAFFVNKKAVLGSPQFSASHLGAKWVFSSAENLATFNQQPEKFLPVWGGHCAWAVSENGGISHKKLSGDFEMIDGRLYLFSFGNNSKDGAKQGFLYGRYSRAMRVRDGEKYWSDTAQRLLDGSVIQPNAASYMRSRFE